MSSGEIHAIINHFPIVFLVSAFVVDLAYLVYRRPALQTAGLLLFTAGALGVAAAVLSGLGVSSNARLVLPSLTEFNLHQVLGYVLLATTVVFALLRVAAWWLFFPQTAVPQVLGGVIIVGLVAATGFFGGRLVYEEGIGVNQGGVYLQTAQGLVNLERFRTEVADPQERGKEAFTQLGCVNCHGETGQGGRGGRLRAEKVRRELAEEHGGLNFPPQLVPQEVIDEIAQWLNSGR